MTSQQKKFPEMLKLTNFQGLMDEIILGSARFAAFQAGTFRFGGEHWSGRFPDPRAAGTGICNRTSVAWGNGDVVPVREWVKYYDAEVLRQAWAFYTWLGLQGVSSWGPRPNLMPEGESWPPGAMQLLVADMHSFWSAVATLLRYGTTGIDAVDVALGASPIGTTITALPGARHPRSGFWSGPAGDNQGQPYFFSLLPECELDSMNRTVEAASSNAKLNMACDSFYIVSRATFAKHPGEESHGLPKLRMNAAKLCHGGGVIALTFWPHRNPDPTACLVPGGFEVGAIVLTHSLQTAALNGLRGRVKVAQGDRVGIAFEGRIGEKALRPANLVRAPPLLEPPDAKEGDDRVQVYAGASPEGCCNLTVNRDGTYSADFARFDATISHTTKSHKVSFGSLSELPPLEQLVLAAGYFGDLRAVREAICRGADVNASRCPGTGFTALEWAGRKGNIDIVAVLLAAGASVRVGEPLAWAAYTGQIPILDLLVASGADPHGNRTALGAPWSIAKENGEESTARWLLGKIAEINSAQRELQAKQIPMSPT